MQCLRFKNSHMPQTYRFWNDFFEIKEVYVSGRLLENITSLAVTLLEQAVVSKECVPVDQFVEHLLPSLLSLASDPVPNVRVLLAKALRQMLLAKGRWSTFRNSHISGKLQQLLKAPARFPLGNWGRLCDSMLKIYYVNEYINFYASFYVICKMTKEMNVIWSSHLINIY